jgi:2-C-methyl-D-erythritol 4-phosphate cytidylyltransferase
MKVAAIIPAAGIGRRMQGNTPKQYLTWQANPFWRIRRSLKIPEVTEVTGGPGRSFGFLSESDHHSLWL